MELRPSTALFDQALRHYSISRYYSFIPPENISFKSANIAKDCSCETPFNQSTMCLRTYKYHDIELEEPPTRKRRVKKSAARYSYLMVRVVSFPSLAVSCICVTYLPQSFDTSVHINQATTLYLRASLPFNRQSSPHLNYPTLPS